MNDQRLFHPHGPAPIPSLGVSTSADLMAGKALQQRLAAPHHKRLLLGAAPASLQAASPGTKALPASA